MVHHITSKSLEKKGLNNLIDNIRLIMDKIGQTPFVAAILIFAGILILLFASTSILTIQRQIVAVNVWNNKINETVVGFQQQQLMSSLFNNVPSGNLMLYAEFKSISRGEIVYTYSNNKIGNGPSFLPNIAFPSTNDTWNMKFELKDNTSRILDSKCLQAIFTVYQKGEKVATSKRTCD
jgi:hypothetical protein